MPTIDNWITTSGSWSDPANWSGDVPGPGSQAAFNGTSNEAITFDTTSTIAELAGTNPHATLDLNGGTLALLNGGAWKGEIAQTGGTFALDGGNFSDAGPLTSTNGATDAIAAGALLLMKSGAIFAGTVTGFGELELGGGGAYTFALGAALSVGTLALDTAASTTLEDDLNYTGSLELGSSSTLDLNGHILTLAGSIGPALLSGDVLGGGTVLVATSADVGGLSPGLLIAQGSTLINAGAIVQDGIITIGRDPSDTAKLENAAGGTWGVVGFAPIAGTGSAAVDNAGLFEKTGIGNFISLGTTDILVPFTNTGTVASEIGVIAFDAAVTNDSILAVADGAGLNIGTPSTTISADPGKSGVIEIGNFGTATIFAAAADDQTVSFSGSNGLLELEQPGSFAGAIVGFLPGDTIDLPQATTSNAFSYSNGTLTIANVFNGVTTATALLDVPGIADPGALALVADGQGGVAIELNHSGPSFTHPTGATNSVTWNALAGGNWTNTAAWSSGAVPGATDDVSFDTRGGTTLYTVTYNTTDTINRLSVDVTLDITGGKLTVLDGVDGGQSSAPNGMIQQTGGTFDAVSGYNLSGAYTLAAGGVLEVDSGVLLLDSGSATLDGTVTGAGTFEFNSGTYVLGPNAAVDVATLQVGPLGIGEIPSADLQLDNDFTFRDFILANNSTVDLNGWSLTLGGRATLWGAINGPGNVIVHDNSASIYSLALAGGATLDVDPGTLIDGGNVDLSNAVLHVAPNSTYDIVGAVDITGNGTVENAGTFEKTAPTGSSFVSPTFSNTGLVAVDLGTLELLDIAGTPGTLAGGTWEAISSVDPAVLVLGGTPISTIAAIVSLSGAGATLESGGASTVFAAAAAAVQPTGAVPLEASLTTIASGGTLDLGSGRSFGASNAVTDAGLISLQGGVFASPSLTVAAGGSLLGDGTIIGPVLLDGTAEALADPLLFAGPVSGSGDALIDLGATLEFGASVANSIDITFGSGTRELQLDQLGSFAGTLVDLDPGNTISLSTDSASGAAISGNVLAITLVDNQTFDIALSNPDPRDVAVLSADHHQVVIEAVPCFARGTRIMTERGNVAVEDLYVDDRALIIDGATRPIVWIGSRGVDCRRHPQPRLVSPVRIRAGAFAENVPQRDLWLSPDHAVFAEGALIPIKHLINGASIVQERLDAVHYFHVELDRHDVLLAEGLPAESYLDTGNRAAFANGGDHIALHPDFSALSWDNACAPLCTEGPAVVAVRQRLLDRMLDAAGLRVSVGGRSIRAVAIKGRLFRFLLPADAWEVEIVSCAATASYLGRRCELGVCIGGIIADGNVVPLDSPALADGFLPIERGASACWRWTEGAARLILPRPSPRPGTLELLVRDAIRTVIAPEERAGARSVA